jgi:lysozyme
MLAFLRKIGVAAAIGTANAAPRAAVPVPVAVSRSAAKPASRLKRSAAAAALCTGLVGGSRACAPRPTRIPPPVGSPGPSATARPPA